MEKLRELTKTTSKRKRKRSSNNNPETKRKQPRKTKAPKPARRALSFNIPTVKHVDNGGGGGDIQNHNKEHSDNVINHNYNNDNDDDSKDKDSFEVMRQRLHVAAVPDTLPCREVLVLCLCRKDCSRTVAFFFFHL